MRSTIIKFNFQKNINLNMELKVLILKVLLTNKTFKISTNKRLLLKLKLLKYTKLYNLFKLKNRCLITNYSKSYSFFNMSRMTIKSLVSKGILTGIRKSSW